MKAYIAAIALALVACKKEPVQVTYGATCDRCTVEYRTGSGQYTTVVVDSYRYILDPDSVKVLETFIVKAEVDAGVVPEIILRRDSGYAFVSLKAGFEERTARVYGDMERLALH